jgi:Ni,Fe-hydrogenase I cytochrome b subunit
MATTSDSRDKFDMHQSLETWSNFLRLTKWVVILTVLLLIWMAIFLTGGNPPPVAH